MYKKLDVPDDYFRTYEGRVMTPVATLVSEYGSKVQIVYDSHSYVIYKSSDKNYKQSAYICADILFVLKELPFPK